MRRSDLEALAQQESRLALRESRRGREIVAVGFKFPWANGDVWAQLPNTAVEHDRFRVAGEDLWTVLREVRLKYGIARTAEVEAVYLWHSHNVHETPSTLDIQNFPEGLISVGLVYHTPTSTTRYYNSSGEISQVPLSTSRTTKV